MNQTEHNNQDKAADRKMVDSGVGWIGEVPEGWEVDRLAKISKLITGNTPDIEDYRVNKNPPLAQDLLDSLKKMERAVNQDIADNHAYASLPVAVYVGPII